MSGSHLSFLYLQFIVENLNVCVCEQDPSIGSSMPVLDLIDAIQSGSIRYDLLKTEDLTEEEKLNNAKFVPLLPHLAFFVKQISGIDRFVVVDESSR